MKKPAENHSPINYFHWFFRIFFSFFVFSGSGWRERWKNRCGGRVSWCFETSKLFFSVDNLWTWKAALKWFLISKYEVNRPLDCYHRKGKLRHGAFETLPFNHSHHPWLYFILFFFYLMFIWFFIIPSYLSLNSFLLVIAPRAPSLWSCLSKKFEQICQADEKNIQNFLGTRGEEIKQTNFWWKRRRDTFGTLSKLLKRVTPA